MSEERQLLKPKLDIVFQSLFNQKNEEITRSFISDLLEENITHIKINETKELFRDNPEDKLGILDLEAEINNSEKIDIEIQRNDKKNLAERMLKYFARLYTLKKGENYEELKRVVVIAIIDYDFDLTKELKQMETIWNLREKKNNEIQLTDKIELHIIELRKVHEEYNRNKKDRKNQWMVFINNPNDKEAKEAMKNNEGIKKAIVEVKKMTEDEKMERLAFLREKAILDEHDTYLAGLDKGEKKGIQEGIQKGINKRNKEIAKAMLNKNIPIKEIIDITGLSNDEIKSLQKSIK